MPSRSGNQYCEGLRRAPRQVWIEGRQVEDVTSHPAFARPISSIAGLYDLQHRPEWSELLTYPSPKTGDPVAISYLAPTTSEELARRRWAIKAWSNATFGMMGRSPDFLNTMVMAFATGRNFLARAGEQFAENILRYYEQCREGDLFLAHAAINPQVDRSKSSSQDANREAHLRVVDRDQDGLIVRGAKMIATLAPIADELVVFPMPGLKPGDESYALAFAIPIETPGLRLICREPIDRGDRSRFDHPLSSRFEEMDATCVFDDVRVPWNRVFLDGDVELANGFYDRTHARHHSGHQGVIRSLVKAQLLTGIAIELARTSKADMFLHVQEMLGQLLCDLELIEGCVLLSESKATLSAWGTLCPAIDPILALRCRFPQISARMIDAIQTLGAGGLMSAPTEQDLHSPIAEDIGRYLRGAESEAEPRIRLLKLAWDISGDAFGQRQQLYERYHAGDPVRLAASQYHGYEKVALSALVRSATVRS